MEQYCSDFCNGEKHAAFFGALLQAQGMDCVDFHNGQVPMASQVDSFEFDTPVKEVTESSKISDLASVAITTASKHTSGTKSKKKKETAADMLATAIIKSLDDKDSNIISNGQWPRRKKR
jgi:hypothetical protein